MLTFHNPGELDSRLITTFGVSIKETSNPIGYFGTGLKYALAVLLRTGHRVEIHSGENILQFHSKKDTIRGKTVELVYMIDSATSHEVQLPFSLDLGRNWEPWMAYRELRSNAMDEGGGVSVGTSHTYLPGCTYIEVEGKAITECHRLQHKYFLSGTPKWQTADCEIYARSGTEIFYRGVKVGDHKLAGLYTYNVLCPMKLTEDRTISEDGQYTLRNVIQSAIMEQSDERFLEEILTAKIRTSMEGNIEYSSWNAPQGESPFTRVVQRLVAAKYDNVNAYARKVAEAHVPKAKLRPQVTTLSGIETIMLGRARNFLGDHFSVPIDTPVHVSAHLGDGVLGLAIDGQVWISRMAFAQGTKMLAGTIYEEWLHITHGLRDECRPMQNFLLDKLMSMAEVCQGEPL